ncbi:MAG: hybrid sensor histidine kinase/response regulator [Anaerolineae bacterium]
MHSRSIGATVGDDLPGAQVAFAPGGDPGLAEVMQPTLHRVASAVLLFSFLWALAAVAAHHPTPYWRGLIAPGVLFFGATLSLLVVDRYALSAMLLAAALLVAALGSLALGEALIAALLASVSVLTTGLLLAPTGAALAAVLLGLAAVVLMPSAAGASLVLLQAGSAACIVWVIGGDIVVALLRAEESESHAWLHANEAMRRRAELKATAKTLSDMYALLERTNRELEVARRQAEEAKEIKARFAANVSHELRTPLNLIMGFSRIMYRSPEVYGDMHWTPELRADVRKIHTASRHLLGMIDDILDLSRIDAQRLPLKLETTDIAALAQDVATTAGGLLRGSSVTLTVELPPDLPRVFVDRTRISQVLLNLLNNAIRFTDSGSIRVRAATAAGEVEVEVSDTGLGIAADDLPTVFEEFSQAKGPITSGRGGTGLGLAVCRQFVQMHGGRISVQSEVGVGSTFRFSLPLPESGRARSRLAYYAPEDWSPPLPENRIGRSVIVVAPESEAARMIARGIEGYRTIPITDTVSLREIVEAEHPSGIVLVRDPLVAEVGPSPEEIWRAAGRPDLGIIEWDVPLPNVAKRYLEVEAYLTKPVEVEALVEAIRRGAATADSFLIVDDDAGFRSLMERVLSAAFPRAGVQACASGEEALQKLEERRYDVAILDLIMEGMGGVAFLRAARAEGLLKGTRVYVATGAPYVEELTSVLSPRLRFSKKAMPKGTEWFGAIKALLEAAPPDYSLPALDPG